MVRSGVKRRAMAATPPTPSKATAHSKGLVIGSASVKGMTAAVNMNFSVTKHHSHNFTPFKPENTRLLARKNDIIIDIREMYDHSKGKTLILSKKYIIIGNN